MACFNYKEGLEVTGTELNLTGAVVASALPYQDQLPFWDRVRVRSVAVFMPR